MSTNPPASARITGTDYDSAAFETIATAIHQSPQLAADMRYIFCDCLKWTELEVHALSSAIVKCTNLRSLHMEMNAALRINWLQILADAVVHEGPSRPLWPRLDTLGLAHAPAVAFESLEKIFMAVGDVHTIYLSNLVGRNDFRPMAPALTRLTSIQSLTGSCNYLEALLIGQGYLAEKNGGGLKNLNLQGLSRSSAYSRLVEKLTLSPIPHPFLASVRTLRIDITQVPPDFGLVPHHFLRLRTLNITWGFVPYLHLFEGAVPGLRCLKVAGIPWENHLVPLLLEFLERSTTGPMRQLKPLRVVEVSRGEPDDLFWYRMLAPAVMWCRERRVSFKWV